MKLLRLDLLAFGPFTDVSLPLDDGQHGLHIIYGPNEAGKSSALRALTQLLYGIPHNSTDNFVHAHQNLRIAAELQNENGEVLHCIRCKGRTSTLRADDDSQVHYERAFREYLEALPAGDDGIPVISADDPIYADELSDGRITLIDG